MNKRLLTKLILIFCLVSPAIASAGNEWKWVHGHNNGGEWWVNEGKAVVEFDNNKFIAKLYITENNHSYLARVIRGKYEKYKISALLDFHDTDIEGIELVGGYDNSPKDGEPYSITLISDYEVVGIARK